MSIQEKRRILSKLYGPSWVAKVDRMHDNQVAAIYEAKLASGELKGIK